MSCSINTTPVCLTTSQTPLMCDSSSPFLQDFCRTAVCAGSNDANCVSSCSTAICSIEGATASITGFLWSVVKVAYRLNPNFLRDTSSEIGSAPRRMIATILMFLYLPIWLLYMIVLTVLLSTRTISFFSFIVLGLVGIGVVVLFVVLSVILLLRQIVDIEAALRQSIKPFQRATVEDILGQFNCVTTPGGYPC